MSIDTSADFPQTSESIIKITKTPDGDDGESTKQQFLPAIVKGKSRAPGIRCARKCQQVVNQGGECGGGGSVIGESPIGKGRYISSACGFSLSKPNNVLSTNNKMP